MTKENSPSTEKSASSSLPLEVSVTFRFREEREERWDGYIEEYLELESVRPGPSNIPPELLDGLIESWGQSVFYHVGVVNAILPALDGHVTVAGDLRW